MTKNNKPTSQPVPTRFPDRPIDAATAPWWIAKVKPRQEKLLAKDFLTNNIEYYLPLCIRNTPRPGSQAPRIFHVPLFPGYISFAQEKPQHIFSSGRVVSVIEIKHQTRFIQELNQIYHLLEGHAPLSPVTATFKPGTPVRIIHGPFKGINGVIDTSSTTSTVILSVECLGNAVLKIDPAWLEEHSGE